MVMKFFFIVLSGLNSCLQELSVIWMISLLFVMQGVLKY